MSFFSHGAESVLDPIMAIDELFRKDTTPGKINLVVGVFQNETGQTPVLECVKAAEATVLRDEGTKAYLPMAGEPVFVKAAEELVLGARDQRLGERHLASIQTPGSTGALRIAGEFIKEHAPAATVWMSTPAYSNHRPIFQAAGLRIAHYRYYDAVRGTLQFEEMLADLAAAAAGDVVLLHGCCHNPTGTDLTPAQWERLARVLTERSLLPLVDAAYLGLSAGMEQDTAGFRRLAAICPESMLAISFSKNFALYSERVGLLSLVADTRERAQRAAGQAKVYVRLLYTSPPSHGAQVVARILGDEALRARWVAELEAMRRKLLDVRMRFADALEEHQVDAALFPAVRDNRGMFMLSRLDKTDAARLRDEHHVYVLDTGRVSFGGMRTSDLPQICAAIAQVTRGRRDR